MSNDRSFLAFILIPFVILTLAKTDLAWSKEKPKIPPGLYPALSLSYEHDDNIYRTEEEALADNLITIQPSLSLKSMWRKHTFEASYFVDILRYEANETENFEDHYLDAEAVLEITKKLKLELAADYANAHEMRGASGTRLGQSEEPDAWWADRLFAEVKYGRKESKNQIVLHGEIYRRRYTNNTQETRSRDRQIYRGTYYHTRKAKTKFLLEVEFKNFDYFDKDAPIDLTSKEQSALVGITWEATAKTSGSIKVGYLIKDMEDAEIPDYEGWSYFSQIVWEPKSYVDITLNLNKRTKESPHTIGSYYVSSEYGADLDWEVSDRWTIKGEIMFQRDVYDTITDTERADDLLDFYIEAELFIINHLDLSFRYLQTSRRSSYPDIDYLANVFMISISYDTMKRRD